MQKKILYSDWKVDLSLQYRGFSLWNESELIFNSEGGGTFIHIQGRKASKREQYTLTSFVVSPLDKHFLSLDPIGNGIFNEAFFFLVLFNNPLSELKKKCIKLYVSLYS